MPTHPPETGPLEGCGRHAANALTGSRRDADERTTDDTRATQNEDRRAQQRVAARRVLERRLCGVWVRQGLAADLIDTLMASVHRVHAADEEAERAYARRRAPGGRIATRV